MNQEAMQQEEQEQQDVEMQEAQDMTPEQMDQLRTLEALLFASAEPLSPQIILERLPEGSDLGVLLPALQANYNERGIQLVEVGGQWAFRTAPDVAGALTQEKEVQKKLSRAALETLAIVAYHQPLTRAEIENIRGVATHKGTLDLLMEQGWVKPGRRRETPGRPLTWVTTPTFLDHFGLETTSDLPGIDDLKAAGLLDKRAAIDTIPDTGDLFDNADEDAEEVLDAEDAEEDEEIAADEELYEDDDNDNDDDFDTEDEE